MRISPSNEGTEWLAKELQWESTSPQDLPGQMRFIQRYVRLFDALATQNGFTPNNAADGLAFSSAVAYAAYHDKDMEKADVEKLRRDWQAYLLKSPGFQGSSEKGKQYTYEQNAFLAMQAAEQRARARRATSNEEKKAFEQKARFFAGFLLDLSKEK